MWSFWHEGSDSRTFKRTGCCWRTPPPGNAQRRRFPLWVRSHQTTVTTSRWFPSAVTRSRARFPPCLKWKIVQMCSSSATRPGGNPNLQEPGGASTARIRRLRAIFADAGFPTSVSANIGGWMLGHTAFVVPIGFALYRFDTNPAALAADTGTLRLMVRATREAFEALDDAEIPANLRWLYLRMPIAFAVRYWRRVLASPRGELWFGAHSRAAPGEMHSLARELRVAIERTGRPTPNLDALVGA